MGVTKKGILSEEYILDYPVGTKANGKFPHKRHRGRGRDWRDADMSQGRQESPRMEEAGGGPLDLGFRDLFSRAVSSVA